MSDDDDFPVLKAYRINGPAQFGVQPVVWVSIQDTQDTMTPEGGLCGRFMNWCVSQRFWTMFPGSSGGGAFTGAFHPQHAEKIRAWLTEQGAVPIPPV